MSRGDLVDRALLVAGQRERQVGEERAARAARRRRGAIPDCSAASARLRATSPTCMRRNSSNTRRRLAASQLRHRLGAVDRPQREVPVDEVVAVEHVLVERVGEAAPCAARERVGDERAQLPREHLGLPRLRVDRHDHAGLLVGAGAPDHVDDRVRHLPLAAVHVELAEERRLGARRQLLLAPRLVEERDVEQRRAVVHDDLDERAPLARAAARERCAPRRTPSPLRRPASSAMSARFVRSTQRRG